MSRAVSGGSISVSEKATEVPLDRLWMQFVDEKRLDELVCIGEICGRSEFGIDGSARFIYLNVCSGGVGNGLSRFSGLHLGNDDITVSTQGAAFSALELSTLSRKMPFLTMIAHLFRSLCLRRMELAMDVCLVPSSQSGAGVGDWGISEISFPDPDGELPSRSSTFPLSGSSL